ncbi:MAG: efflux RND transporter permease subunit [Endomicrobiales bacterium]|nr:efflux RND transporter permease subunit [Endomicrobiales bacterium]
MNFLRLPIDRPVTTVMIFVGIALLGFISWTKIPQELFPSLEYPQITIVTKFEGAGPEESEKLISKIVEEAAGTVKNIKKVSSISKEGASIVTCEFRWGTNMNFAAMEVREKIDLIKEALPREAYEPIVLKYNPMQVEAIIISASYTTPNPNPWKMADLRVFCKKNIKDEMERLDGVAKVEIRGGEKKEIIVEIDKGRLLANQASITEVISSLRDANITYPAGTIKEDNYEYLVKTVGEFKSIEDISALSFGKQDQSQGSYRRSSKRVRGEAPGTGTKTILIRDIADVRETLRDKTGYSRYNRRENISLGIYPQSGSNLIKISKAVHKKLKEIQHKFPNDVEVKIIYDQSEFVKNSLNNIYQNALKGGALSFIILYLFMKSVLGSIIINIAIPITMLVTLCLMYFGNISINTMSLGGLTVGIGLVVDNSNIVLENILHVYHKDPARDKKEVVFQATKEVVGPILSSTLTTISIFLPFIFVTGMAGQLFKQLALTITFSMLASIFVALILVPRLAMASDLSKQSIKVGRKAIDKYFTPYLKKVLNWPLKKMLFYALVYFAVGFICYMLIPKEFMPKVDERRFVLNLSMHPKTPLDTTNEISKRIESLLSKYPEIKDLSATVGSTGEKLGSASMETLEQYQARIIARLENGGMSTNALVAELSDEIRKWNVNDLEAEFVTQQGLFGSGVGATSGITVEVKGRDLDKLKAISEKLKRTMSDISETFYGIKVVPTDLVPELKLQIDRERASLFGLSTQDISAMTLAAIKGYVATKLKTKDEEFDIRVRMREKDRDTLEKVTEMTAYSPWGMTIQLKQVAQVLFVKTMPEIRRTEGQRTYLVTSNIKGSFSKAVTKLQQIIKDINRGDEISMTIAGEMIAMRESMASSVFAVLLGFIIVYMILASQFESLLQPGIVMTAVPLALIGAIITLLVTFKSINSVSMLGIIMLVGNAVNISIILVDRYNLMQQRNPAMPIESVIIESTVEHIRPIMMTTLTTVIDLFPLALGIGAGAEATAPLAIAVVGGLTFALVLSLFFVPYVYFLMIQGRLFPSFGKIVQGLKTLNFKREEYE